MGRPLPKCISDLALNFPDNEVITYQDLPLFISALGEFGGNTFSSKAEFCVIVSVNQEEAFYFRGFRPRNCLTQLNYVVRRDLKDNANPMLGETDAQWEWIKHSHFEPDFFTS